MVRAAAQHARAPPHPLGAGRVDVRLAWNFPTAQSRGIEVSQGLLRRCCAAVRSVVGPLEHRRLLGAIEPIAGFQHADLRAGICEYLSSDPAPGARADYHDIVCFRSCLHLGHAAPTFKGKLILLLTEAREEEEL